MALPSLFSGGHKYEAVRTTAVPGQSSRSQGLGEGEAGGYHGEYHSPLPMLSWLPRAESADLTNDPRIFGDNALVKRMVAFRTICITASLMAGLSADQLKEALMSEHFGVVQSIGLILQTFSFSMNLFTVVVVSQQVFQTYRILTASAVGFDFAKSYYLSPRVTFHRHAAIRAFFFSLPMFVLSMACKIWAHLQENGSHLILACIVDAILLMTALLLLFVYQDHRNIFSEKYTMMMQHQQPLLTHLTDLAGEHREGLSHV